ncbi:MAG: DHH family phosphoesterase, partial [Elusimicrobiota bacterium]
MQNNKLSEIADILKEYNNIIISSHVHLDGDALGSEIALYLMLRQLGKDVRIINQDITPDIYQF